MLYDLSDRCNIQDGDATSTCKNWAMDVTANLCEYGSLSAKMDRKYSRPYGLRLPEMVQLNLDIKKLTIHSKD